jgi:ankyrin repeat protein
MSPIHLAALGYHFNVVNFLIQIGQDINARMADGSILFHSAIRKWDTQIEIVDYLIEHHVAQIADNKGVFPIHLACGSHNLDLVTALFANGADLSIRDRKELTPLHWAVKHKSYPIVLYLLDADTFVDAVDARGRTPLHYAAISGHLGIVEVLYDYGADPHAIDFQGVLVMIMKPLSLSHRLGKDRRLSII